MMKREHNGTWSWVSSAAQTTPYEPHPTNFLTLYRASIVKSVPRTLEVSVFGTLGVGALCGSLSADDTDSSDAGIIAANYVKNGRELTPPTKLGARQVAVSTIVHKLVVKLLL